MAAEYEQVQIEWRAWLAEHGDDSPGVWLVTFKQAAGERHVATATWSRRRCALAGWMTPSGLDGGESARADCSWTALADVENLIEPDDLRPPWIAGRRRVATGPASHARRGILEWIASAKRPETRARRIAETADSAAQGVRANQWRAGQPVATSAGPLTSAQRPP